MPAAVADSLSAMSPRHLGGTPPSDSAPRRDTSGDDESARYDAVTTFLRGDASDVDAVVDEVRRLLVEAQQTEARRFDADAIWQDVSERLSAQRSTDSSDDDDGSAVGR